MQKNQTEKETRSGKILTFDLGKKSVIWISEINKYILAEPFAAEIFQDIHHGKSKEKIIHDCIIQYDLTKEMAEKIVQEIQVQQKNLLKLELSSAKKSIEGQIHGISELFSKKYYLINDVIFYVEYETQNAELINHPKFAHLEIRESADYDHHFQVMDNGEKLSLIVDGQHEGSWPNADSHFLAGKFSMQIIQKIYNKDEDRWMGVFHAAGITNGEKCIMFYGDSGNGKSTLSALLMAAGLDVLSDDFLPVESESGKIFRFPAALSVKKKAYDLIIPHFPDLLNAEEYVNPALQKTFRYLIPENKNPSGVPCRVLVFIKFDKTIEFRMERMEPEDAFAKLVPDSWINPSEENAKKFMKWFSHQEYYRLTYSNNEKMISTIKKMLNTDD